MNHLFIKTFFSLCLFAGLFCCLQIAQAQMLNVIFESQPLFKEANFLPGHSVTRWAKVTNTGELSQRIAIEAINISDPDSLASAINLEITEGGTTLQNMSLADFFNHGELYLSDLAGNNTQTQYDFIASFAPRTTNNFQGKTLSFDILLGFQGTEGGIPSDGNGGGGGSGGSSGSGGGGGSLPPGLTIQDENVIVIKIGETTATVIWPTSYPASSQVIYASEHETYIFNLTDNLDVPPDYGYPHTTPESDLAPNRVTNHSVALYDLTPGTEYHIRAVSHASLAISREHNFTTLNHQDETLSPTEEPSVILPASPKTNTVVLAEQSAPSGQSSTPINRQQPPTIDEPQNTDESLVPESELEPNLIVPQESQPASQNNFFNNLMAGLNNLFGDLGLKCYHCMPWWLLLILAVYSLYKSFQSRQWQKKAGTAWLVWTIILGLLSLIYFLFRFFCIPAWIILMAILITILMRWAFAKYQSRKEKEPEKFNYVINQDIIFVIGLILVALGLIAYIASHCLSVGLLIIIAIYFIISEIFLMRNP